MNNNNRTLSLAIMSGKGGVGKTNLALNLGLALHQAGHKLMLMDCDLGLANLDVLLGLSPDKNMQDLISSEASGEDVILPIEEEGFDFLPAASGVPELVEMDEDMQSILFDKLVKLFYKYDFLILDLGAGINQTVLSFATMTQLRIIVVTPEPTSLTDSYALMKVLNTQQGINDFLIVINQASSQSEAKQTFERLHAACEKFLNINIRLLGVVREDGNVLEAVRRQTPLLKHAPGSNAGKDFQALASKIDRFRKDNLDLIRKSPALKPFPGTPSD